MNDFLILDRDRDSMCVINFTNTPLKKYLKKCIPKTDEYVDNIINVSEKIGLKSKANYGATIGICISYFLFQAHTKE